MKQTKTLLAFLAVLTFTANIYGQSPYDFSATAPSGQTLYYKIIDSTQVGVVHPNNSGSNSEYASGDLIIPDSVSFCGNTYTVTQLITHHFIQGAFTQCSTLTSVYIPNTVKNIGDYSFTYCNSLVSVHLPDSITYIGTETFKHCSILPTITLGRFVTFINYGAFLQCSALTEIHSLNNVAPDISSGTFYSMPDSVAIYIPCGSTASYVSEWRSGRFTFIEEPGFVLDITASSNEHGSAEIVSHPTCDNPQALLLATANEGYHFDHWSNGSTDNPLTITLTTDTSLTAFFALDSLSVSVVSNDETMGSVTGGGTYAYGDTVTLTATADEGYHFEGWGITPGYQNIVTENPLTIIVTQDMSIIAYFVADSTEGISGVEMLNAKVYSSKGQIVVDGAEGESVRIYDITGRSVRNKALHTGVYIVKVGDRPARKVVVMK